MLREGIAVGATRELREGWYFPFLSNDVVGCNGVIVNKRSGKLFHLGSAFPPERDLALYDQGYQFERYDLVISTVRDRERTLTALRDLRLSVVEPKDEDGVVWKIPREMTNTELSRMLDRLPCVVPDSRLYFVAEVLENARRAGWFTFEAREHVPPASRASAGPQSE
jgi:hypothetical protein